jgi:hypothetical protein
MKRFKKRANERLRCGPNRIFSFNHQQKRSPPATHIGGQAAEGINFL